MSGSFLSRHGAKILALIPLVFLAGTVAWYSVDVPYLDQWELVPLLGKMYHGELTFHDLWVPHNEHRLLFPQIIMLALARLTRWDIRYELAVNLLLALGIFAVFAHQIKMTGRKTGITGLSWAIPAVSLVVFSLSQYQNWLWGWQLQMLLNLLCVTGGIMLLANQDFRWHRFAAAAALGIVATFSFADGILFWPIGLFTLFLVTVGAREQKAALFAWIGIASLALGAFFYHYQLPQNHQPFGLVFKYPFEYTAYLFKFIGGICEQDLCGEEDVDGALAFFFGLAATSALGWAAWMLVRRSIVSFRLLVPWLALSLYSVGCALLSGGGRLVLGTDQALSSRYCTMVTPLWVSLIVLLFLLARGGGMAGSPRSVPGPGFLPWNSSVLARGLLRAVLVLLILGSVFALSGAARLSRAQTFGRARLLELAANPHAGPDPSDLVALHPNSQIVLERYPILLHYRLSLFRPSASDPR